jgi:hypothetical protein
LRTFAISDAPSPCAFIARIWAASIEAWPALVDARGLSLRDSFELALAAEVRLEYAKNVEEALARRGAGVDGLLGGLQ